MFVSVPDVVTPANGLFRVDSDGFSPSLVSLEAYQAESPDLIAFLQAVVEGLFDGVMIVSDKREILKSNLSARQLCRRFNAANIDEGTLGQVEPLELLLPDEIWQVCQTALERYDQFPDQGIVGESEVLCSGRMQVRIRAQRLHSSYEDESSQASASWLLVTLEDRGQSIQNVAIADMQKFELTPREAQVWQLRLAGRSYREIANELYITDNTVKKHIKSILSKRRSTIDDE